MEERTKKFAKNVGKFVEKLSKSLSNFEYCKQVVRSSASVGANYIEANKALSKKDFVMRIKICRKESKETGYWLRLIESDSSLHEEKNLLIQESIELMKIFGSILNKTK